MFISQEIYILYLIGHNTQNTTQSNNKKVSYFFVKVLANC